MSESTMLVIFLAAWGIFFVARGISALRTAREEQPETDQSREQQD